MTIVATLVIIVLVLGIAYAWYNYHAKHRHSYNEEQLRGAVAEAFADVNGAPMSKDAFANKLKAHLSCSHKEALYLAGAAIKRGLVRHDGKDYVPA